MGWQAQRFRGDSHSASLWPDPRRQHRGEAHSLGSKCPSHLLWSSKHSLLVAQTWHSHLSKDIKGLFPQVRKMIISSAFLTAHLPVHQHLLEPSPGLSHLLPKGLREIRRGCLGATWDIPGGLPAPPGLSKPPCPPQPSFTCCLQGVFLIAPVPLTSQSLTPLLLNVLS